MKKIKTFLLLAALIFSQWLTVSAQSIGRKVISSSGGTLTGGSSMVTFSIGETVIPTLTAGSTVLTQGFEQPGEQLSTGTVSNSICAGSSINVPYEAIDIGGGNVFTAQLSDASGNFASFVVIGTASGNASGTILATIPSNTPGGTGYRIRVISSFPSVTGSDNGSNIVVNTPSIAATGASSNALYGQICLGANVTLTATGGSLGSGGSWLWYEGGCALGTAIGSGASVTITPNSNGAHTYFVRAEGACAPTACQSVTVNVISAPPPSTVQYTATLSAGCVGAAATTISVNSATGCTFYRWTSAQAGVRFNGVPGPYETTTPSVNISFVSLPAAGSSGWSICVFGSNACGNTNTVCTWIRATVSTPTSIAGPITGCPSSTGIAYSSSAVAGAAFYQWSSTGGIIINSNGSQSITVDFPAGFVSGTLRVHGQTSCGYNGADRVLTITRAPAIPGVITGTSYPCPNASAAYSIAAVTGAVNYTWTTTVPGAVVTGNTNSCSILFPASIPGGSTVSVVANSSCPFSSPVRAKGVASGVANTPTAISGPASGQCGATGVSYSINPVAQATGYNWTTSCGTISGPSNLSAVTVDWPAGFTSCILTVSATNSCGTGGSRTLTVAGAPGLPAAITGNAAPCAGYVEMYSTAGSTGATSYIWTVPSGATILGPADGSSILLQWGASSGSITVKSTNACGISSIRSLPCTISCRMNQATTSGGTIQAEVYPNPVIDNATLRFISTAPGHYTLEMTNTIGQIVYSTKGSASEGVNEVELDLGAISKGMYMLHLSSGEQTGELKVVVH